MAKSCLYSYEEFSDHLKAMKTVRQWEDTSRFGHVGADQSSRANNARVLEYFCDSYADPQEAVKKADIFLSIHDYIGRNVAPLSRKQFIDMLEDNLLSIDPALLRAVHYVFTAGQEPARTDPKTVLALAQTFQKL